MRPLLLLQFATTCFAQTIVDDFGHYPASSDGSPNWLTSAVGIEMQDGACLVDDGYILWQKAPFAKTVTFTAELTVTAITGLEKDWKTAGIGLYQDNRNFWALNLVQSPEKDGGRHFVELQEMLDGTWLATSQEKSRLKGLGMSGDQQWEVGHAYQFELRLADGKVHGTIRDGERLVFQTGYDLAVGTETPAVRAGRPALKAAGMSARFDNAKVTVTQTAPEPKSERVIPPWVSRDAPQLTKGTGFFQAVQQDGRWWLADPEGKAFFDVGTDHANYDAHWCETLGYAPYHRNMEAKFGSSEKWAESTSERLREWGFNTVAAGHHPSLRHKGLVHILFASFGSRFARQKYLVEPINWTGFPDVFDPGWERSCKIIARGIEEQSKDDPWCLGTFLDNELEWYGKHGRMVDEIFKLPADSSGKQALWRWMTQQYQSVKAVNELLGTSYTDEPSFLASVDVPTETTGLTELNDAFLPIVAERYFSVSTKALREADPQHLVMGCRFAGRTPEVVLTTAGKYNDVFTINTYPRVDLNDGVVQGTPQQLVDYERLVQRPMIITEWSFPALDSGLPCQHGAGMRVDTQAQKARCYQVFADMIADLPFMVGYHYFMWVDEPKEGISSTFPEDSNYGLVNVNDEPYTTLVDMATKVNRGAFARHAGSQASGTLEIEARVEGYILTNPGTADGWADLMTRVAGQWTTERVTLASQHRLSRKWGEGQDMAALRRWDGTVERAVRVHQVKVPTVVNLGVEPAAGVPVAAPVKDKLGVCVASIGAGASQPLAAAPELQPVAELKLEGPVTWQAPGADGALFDVAAGDLQLGRLAFALHQQIAGQHQWIAADQVESLQTAELPEATVVRAVVAYTGTGKPITAVDEEGQQAAQVTGPARYRAEVETVVFKQLGLALVRPLWVRSTDPREWDLVDAFWFCRPEIGGQTAGDQRGGPQVPNYYLKMNLWTDEQLGGAFGATSVNNTWNINFWADNGGGLHPDARQSVNVKLAPDGSWSNRDNSWLWVYGRRRMADFAEVEQLAQQAAELAVWLP